MNPAACIKPYECTDEVRGALYSEWFRVSMFSGSAKSTCENGRYCPSVSTEYIGALNKLFREISIWDEKAAEFESLLLSSLPIIKKELGL